MKPRLTELRKKILQVINASGRPLSAKNIFEKIPSRPNLSTVYRALDFLEKEKYVHSVSFSRIKFYMSKRPCCEKMRDILIHEYFGIDLKLTWRVVKLKIPELKEKILEIKEALEKERL